MGEPDILKYLKADRTVVVDPGSDISGFLDANDLLAVLKTGTAELTSESGKTRVTLKPGTPLGIFRKDPQRPKGSITAITECTLIPLDEEGLATLVEFNPRFTRDLLGVMVESVRSLVRNLA